MRILLIEDDKPIASAVRRGLHGSGFDVEEAADGKTGLQMALDREYGAIVLDLMLPGLNGWQVCESLRARQVATPILMLTARDAVGDRIHGLEIGADDYLPKPFEFGELLARIRALLRRDRLNKGRVIQVADLELDTSLRRVKRSGQEIVLTPREYALLEALAANAGRVLTREMIQNRVWSNEESYSNIVDAHVASLRRKVDGQHAVKLLHTVHGFGYTLKRPDTEGSG